MSPLRTTVYASLATVGLAAVLTHVKQAPPSFVVRQQLTIDAGIGQNSRGMDPDYSGAVPGTVSPPPSGARTQASAGRGNLLWAIPLASLTATRERPIFSASRRPPAVVELASAPSKPVPDQPRRPSLSLVGAIAGEAESIAIFLDEPTRRIVRLKMGESYAGWTLRAVTNREATLQRGRENAIFAFPTPAK